MNIQNNTSKKNWNFTALAIGIHNFSEGFKPLPSLDSLSLDYQYRIAIAI